MKIHAFFIFPELSLQSRRDYSGLPRSRSRSRERHLGRAGRRQSRESKPSASTEDSLQSPSYMELTEPEVRHPTLSVSLPRLIESAPQERLFLNNRGSETSSENLGQHVAPVYYHQRPASPPRLPTPPILQIPQSSLSRTSSTGSNTFPYQFDLNKSPHFPEE